MGIVPATVRRFTRDPIVKRACAWKESAAETAVNANLVTPVTISLLNG